MTSWSDTTLRPASIASHSLSTTSSNVAESPPAWVSKAIFRNLMAAASPAASQVVPASGSSLSSTHRFRVPCTSMPPQRACLRARPQLPSKPVHAAVGADSAFSRDQVRSPGVCASHASLQRPGGRHNQVSSVSSPAQPSQKQSGPTHPAPHLRLQLCRAHSGMSPPKSAGVLDVASSKTGSSERICSMVLRVRVKSISRKVWTWGPRSSSVVSFWGSQWHTA
mmetsp:Transcript_75652/g.202246  ORF Transcript_75652/g.202246 Transcript_75652/m.202246 type:complete len:223 (+) Transcript_75652:1220-1888(+)